MKKVAYFCIALWFIVLSDTSFAANKFNLKAKKLPPITFYTEHFPPANYMQDDKLVGITVDSLEVVWNELNLPEQYVRVVPWIRGYKSTLKTPNAALFTMSRTPARENLFKWVGPLFKSVHVLMAKKSDNLKLTNLADVLGHKVSTIKGDISEISLRQIGMPDFNIAKVDNLERAFIMMQSGRVDMMMVSIHGFQHLTKRLDVDASKYEQVWKVNEIGNYVAFNLETPDKVIEAYQKAFDKVARQRTEIKKKYALPEIEF